MVIGLVELYANQLMHQSPRHCRWMSRVKGELLAEVAGAILLSLIFNIM